MNDIALKLSKAISLIVECVGLLAEEGHENVTFAPDNESLEYRGEGNCVVVGSEGVSIWINGQLMVESGRLAQDMDLAQTANTLHEFSCVLDDLYVEYCMSRLSL